MNPQPVETTELRRQAEQCPTNLQDPDDRARACLTLGCLSEQEQDWASAIAHYRDSLATDPRDPTIRYFGHNNLGYALIQLKRFDEAEDYCTAAIEIDPERHNAHKNLGLVYDGQGRWLDAAFSFATAYRLNPRDPRAWRHLEQLLAARPQLLDQSAELRGEVDALRALIDGRGARTH
jgi:tetratricopeptide (TPR) repeat protein